MRACCSYASDHGKRQYILEQKTCWRYSILVILATKESLLDSLICSKVGATFAVVIRASDNPKAILKPGVCRRNEVLDVEEQEQYRSGTEQYGEDE